VERGNAEKVKQEKPILGDPPYKGFAGMAVTEERALSTAYRTTTRVRRPEGQGLNGLLGCYFNPVQQTSQHSRTSPKWSKLASARARRGVPVHARLRPQIFFAPGRPTAR
jgi:hypothetical protein